MRKPRVAFYCHNTYGLGHVVRSLTIAEAAVAIGAECSVITGCRHIAKLRVPSAIDVHTIAPVEMDAIGRPTAAAEDPDQSNITVRRSKQILEFCLAWKPDTLVVDHHPLGLAGELVDTLLCPELSAMQCVWGVPYPEDMPSKPYRNPRLSHALGRYQHLLAYSDQQFDDILETWAPALLPAKVDYVGVVTDTRVSPRMPKRGGWIVALCGGGYGSNSFHRLILDATARFASIPLRIVAGPQASEQTVKELALGRQVEVLGSTSVEKALEDAAVVISRTGYNTAFHLVQTSLPVIFVPRKLLNDDQPRRAVKLAQLKNIWSIHEDRADATAMLESAIDAALNANTEVIERSSIDLNGALQAAECIVSSLRSYKTSERQLELQTGYLS